MACLHLCWDRYMPVFPGSMHLWFLWLFRWVLNLQFILCVFFKHQQAVCKHVLVQQPATTFKPLNSEVINIDYFITVAAAQAWMGHTGTCANSQLGKWKQNRTSTKIWVTIKSKNCLTPKFYCNFLLSSCVGRHKLYKVPKTDSMQIVTCVCLVWFWSPF